MSAVPTHYTNDYTTRIGRKFIEFHNNNLDVYTELVNLAFQLKRVGYKEYGIKGLFEVLRWQRSIRTVSSKFKLNNNYTSYYARLIMSRNPGLRGFFRLRGLSVQEIE